ncbi:MAG TPA: ATP-binding cassette domain-containing protein [Acetobacteraceae bacterium]|nr:ATP-binding cassette domain-containing protein [Acetobacteraceae bacterium]
MMEVRNLVAGYGRIGVLNGLSLTVDDGACVGVLGHNGMGKTTLLKTVMGLLPASSGTIRLGGRPIEHWSTSARARAGLGYVPQGRQIFPGLSVRENLLFAIAARPGTPRAALDAVLADFPELTRLLDRPGGALSGGEQQLLALARALCGRPKLLLLDEPTEGIQPSIVQAMIARIGALRHRDRLAVLLVEQNLDFIQGLADRALLIQRGRITREISRESLTDAALVREFIGTG